MASVLRKALLSLFFPKCCAMCEEYIGEEENVLCRQCLTSLPRTEQAAIQDNNTEMALWGEAHSRAEAKRIHHLERAVAFMFFEKDHIGNLLAETSRPMTKLRDKSVQTE